MERDDAPAGIGHNNATRAELLAEKHADLAKRIDAIAKRADAAPRSIKTDADLDAIGRIVVDARDLAKEAETARTAEKEPHLRASREIDAYFKVSTDRLGRISDFFRKIADDHARAKAAEARAKAEKAAREAAEEAERQADIARRAEEAGRVKTAEKHEAKAELASEQAFQAQQVAAAPAADLVRHRTGSGVVSSARTEWAFEIVKIGDVPLDLIRPFIKPEHIEQAVRAFVRINKNSVPLAGVRIFEDVKSTFR